MTPHVHNLSALPTDCTYVFPMHRKTQKAPARLKIYEDTVAGLSRAVKRMSLACKSYCCLLSNTAGIPARGFLFTGEPTRSTKIGMHYCWTATGMGPGFRTKSFVPNTTGTPPPPQFTSEPLLTTLKPPNLVFFSSEQSKHTVFEDVKKFTRKRNVKKIA